MNILLIGPKTATSHELRKKLETLGNQIHPVLNCSMGRKQLEIKYEIDVVIININSTSNCPLEFLKWISGNPRMSQIPVIVAGDNFEESTLGKFVEFGVADIIVLPVQADTLEAKMARAELNGKRTVLVVDDEPVILELLQEFLEIERFKVVPVESAEGALEVLHKRKIDVVVTDIMLPGMRGTDLLPQIKNEFPGIPVILITGFSGRITPTTAIAMGADGYFAKPFHNRDLAFTLRKVLNQVGSIPSKASTTN